LKKHNSQPQFPDHFPEENENKKQHQMMDDDVWFEGDVLEVSPTFGTSFL
jgi:hypothetical protein